MLFEEGVVNELEEILICVPGKGFVNELIVIEAGSVDLITGNPTLYPSSPIALQI